MKHRRFAILASLSIGLGGGVISCTLGPKPNKQVVPARWTMDAATRVQAWQEDIDYLAAELPRRHKNAFFKCRREAFAAAAATLRESVPRLADHQVVVGMMKLAAMIGDAHTGISLGELDPPWRSFPLSVYVCKDGPVIVAASESQKDLIGFRLVKFGDVPLDEAFRRVAEASAYENEATFKSKAPRLLVIPEIAQSVGVIPSLNEATLVIADFKGREQSVQLTPLGPDEKLTRHTFDESRALMPRRKPVYRNWYRILPIRRVLYFRYNTCADEPGQTVAELSEEMLSAIDANRIERVLIDLRGNGGGNSGLLHKFIRGLSRRSDVHRPGGVIVLIGRNTFSSAHLNALALKKYVGATLIGEPTGQKPNAYGEVRWFQLPHSKIVVRYSTKFWRTEPGDRPSMEPDVLVELSSADYFAPRDPVFEAALAYEPK